MSLFWAIPVVVLALGLIPLLASVGRVAGEIRALRVDLQRAASLRPAVVEVVDDGEAVRRRIRELRGR